MEPWPWESRRGTAGCPVPEALRTGRDGRYGPGPFLLPVNWRPGEPAGLSTVSTRLEVAGGGGRGHPEEWHCTKEG